MVFFCKQLYAHVQDKFPKRAETIISDFLFDKWLIAELCTTRSNKNGLISDQFVKSALARNLALVKDALVALLSSQDDYLIVLHDLPSQMAEACDSRRG